MYCFCLAQESRILLLEGKVEYLEGRVLELEGELNSTVDTRKTIDILGDRILLLERIFPKLAGEKSLTGLCVNDTYSCNSVKGRYNVNSLRERVCERK